MTYTALDEWSHNYAPLRSISSGEILFNAHNFRRKGHLCDKDTNENSFLQFQEDRIKEEKSLHEQDPISTSMYLSVPAPTSILPLCLPNHKSNINASKLSMRLGKKADDLLEKENFLFSSKMYDFLNNFSSIEHFQQTWTNIEQLTSTCRERKSNLHQRKIATYESSKAICRSLITQALHGVKGGETFCNDAFMSTTRRIDNELCRCICRLMCANEMEYTLLQQSMFQLRKLDRLSLQKAQLIRDLALFNLHLQYETRGEIGLKRLSPSNPQYQRCKKAATENIKPGYFPEYSLEESSTRKTKMSPDPPGNCDNKTGSREEEKDSPMKKKLEKNATKSRKQNCNENDFKTKGKSKYSLKVLEVYKIENQPLLREFQGSANDLASGKVKGLFFPVDREALEQIIVNGVTMSCSSKLSSDSISDPDGERSHQKYASNNINTTKNSENAKDVTKKKKSSKNFSCSPVVKDMNQDDKDKNKQNDSSKNGSGLPFLKDAWFQISGNSNLFQSTHQKSTIPTTTRSYAKRLVQASKAPTFPCFFSRYSTFEQDRKHLMNQLDQDIEVKQLDLGEAGEPIRDPMAVSGSINENWVKREIDHDDCNDVSKLRYLVLCRVLMGKIYVTNEKLTWHPNKILHNAFNSKKDIEKWGKILEQAEGCDCIYSSANEEYFVINPNYVLPEFLVVYRLKGMTEEKWTKRLELINNKEVKLNTNASILDQPNNQNIHNNSKIKPTFENNREEEEVQCNLAMTYDEICFDLLKLGIPEETAIPKCNTASLHAFNLDSWYPAHINNIIAPISPYPLTLTKPVEQDQATNVNGFYNNGQQREVISSLLTLDNEFLLRDQKNNRINDSDQVSIFDKSDEDQLTPRQNAFLKRQFSLLPLQDLDSIRKHMLSESDKGDFSKLLRSSEGSDRLLESDFNGDTKSNGKGKNSTVSTAILDDYEGEVQEELAWQSLTKKKFVLVRKYLRLKAERIFVGFWQKQKELMKETEQVILSGLNNSLDMPLYVNDTISFCVDSRKEKSTQSEGNGEEKSIRHIGNIKSNNTSSLTKGDMKMQDTGSRNKNSYNGSTTISFQAHLPHGLFHPVLEHNKNNVIHK